MARRKFGGGEPLKVHHTDHNRWQDAGDHHGATFGGNTGTPLEPDEQTGVIMVKNTTGRNLPRFSVLTLYGSLTDPTYGSQLTDFKNQIVLKGIEPTSTIAGRFCVTQADAADGETVAAIVSGLTPCLIKVESLTDEFADIETDNDIDQTRYLKSGSSGSAQIMFVPTATGEQWGVVRLGNRVVSSGLKIVEASSTLYAAFGGEACYYASVASNALAISTGNFVPYTAASGSIPESGTAVQRKVYPVSCEVQELDSDNNLRGTGEFISVFNPDSLPIHSGYYHVTKHSGDLWTVVSPYGNHQHNSGGFFTSQGGQSFSNGQTKLITNSWSVQAATTNAASRFLYAVGESLYITHPGHYKITYGGSLGVSSDATNQYTTSGGHTVDVETGSRGTLSLWTNFNPSDGDVATQYGTQSQFDYASIIIPPSRGGASYNKTTGEKTVHITTSLDNWHGQPYTRLNLSLSCESDGTASDGAINFRHVWINVTAMGGYGQQNIGSGYNAFLGTDGAFQWWGGGTEPQALDEDGAFVP